MKAEISRRKFITSATLAALGLAMTPYATLAAAPSNKPVNFASFVEINTTINGQNMKMKLDPRTSLLDLLREQLGLTGSKKGCNQGACGACTVHMGKDRINSCLTLAAQIDGKEVTTIEGIGSETEFHPIQVAFMEHDGYQCGYCTPGQIMSAIKVLEEDHAGSDAEIREWMSGNICRCGAYKGIVEAVKSVRDETYDKKLIKRTQQKVS
ncbi:MAG TPA: (2Fe-2S)-binding protein [Leeuwenhoekiella sp.]|nr:(2Fe-2S)-binding protein [Leeuwenhoekiella sp.]